MSTLTVMVRTLVVTPLCVTRPKCAVDSVTASSFLSLTFRQGGKEYVMRAHFGLPSVESEELDAKRPVTVNFEIPYFTVSGIQVWTVSALSKKQ